MSKRFSCPSIPPQSAASRISRASPSKDEEVEHLKDELNGILAFVAQLDEVDVEGVEPMTSVTPMAMKKREDVVTDGGIAEDIVKNAPATEDHFFLVSRRWWNSHVLGLPGSGERERIWALIDIISSGQMPAGHTAEDLRAMGLPQPGELYREEQPDGTILIRQLAPSDSEEEDRTEKQVHLR